MVTTLSIDVIVSDPNVRRVRPIIAGTGIRVMDIAAYHIFDHQTPEQLAAGFMQELWIIHAALAYYFRHKAIIDADMRADQQEAEVLLQALRAKGKVIDLEIDRE
jgi:uncharacterized protein (DUF433 family)